MVYAHWVGPVLHGSAVIGFGSCVISVDLSLTLENSSSAVQVSSVRHTHTHTHAEIQIQVYTVYTFTHKSQTRKTEMTIELCTHHTYIHAPAHIHTFTPNTLHQHKFMHTFGVSRSPFDHQPMTFFIPILLKSC